MTAVKRLSITMETSSTNDRKKGKATHVPQWPAAWSHLGGCARGWAAAFVMRLPRVWCVCSLANASRREQGSARPLQGRVIVPLRGSPQTGWSSRHWSQAWVAVWKRRGRGHKWAHPKTAPCLASPPKTEPPLRLGCRARCQGPPAAAHPIPSPGVRTLSRVSSDIQNRSKLAWLLRPSLYWMLPSSSVPGRDCRVGCWWTLLGVPVPQAG
jgi:hypothetical protein